MYHKSPQVFSNYELAKIGKCTEKTVEFDLSRISSDQFSSLIATLQTRGINEFTDISLNLDLLMNTKARDKSTLRSKTETKTSKSRISRPFALEMSAIGRRKNLTKEIAGTLSRIITESKTLLNLSLRSIPFSQNDIGQICQALSVGHTLQSLHLEDIPLCDSGFALLSRALKRELILDLQCRKCRLTDASAPDLHSLISYHVSLQSEAQWRESLASKGHVPIICLSRLDLRDNEFSFNLIRVIHDSILDLPITLLDLRGNIGITESVIQQLQYEIPHTEIKTGISKPIRAKKTTKKAVKKKKNIAGENKKLRGLVDTLKRGSEIVEIEPDLAIVGPRANELAEHIKRLDEILSSWANGPAPFLESRRNTMKSKTLKKTITHKKSVPKKTSEKNKNTDSSHRRSKSTSRRPKNS